jgi:ubiquinone/menaquinone biosynthesis C-methylase UbiE
MGRARFEAEFGPYSAWVVEAIRQIGLKDRVPAACRGTGNPSLLEHLAAELEIEKGACVLDVGVGLGGPGAWLVRHRSCKLVGVDIMIESARGATQLFGDIQAAVASTRALPFKDRTFDAAWALGVIEMIADKKRAFEEIARVLLPGARLVLYDFVATGSQLRDPPAASRFESAADISEKLKGAGFNVLRSEAVPFVSPPPEGWQAAAVRVRERIRDEHRGDRRLAMAEEGLNSFNRVRRSGSIREWEFVAEKPSR